MAVMCGRGNGSSRDLRTSGSPSPADRMDPTERIVQWPVYAWPFYREDLARTGWILTVARQPGTCTRFLPKVGPCCATDGGVPAVFWGDGRHDVWPLCWVVPLQPAVMQTAEAWNRLPPLACLPSRSMALSNVQGRHVPVKLWTPLDQVESQALTQLKNVAALPWVFHHIAAMPDVHYGIGATVGSVIAMKDAVAPAAVGVDIGCGMAAVRTNLVAEDLPDSPGEIRTAIEDAIPVGFNMHRDVAIDRSLDPGDREGRQLAKALFRDFDALSPAVQKLRERALHQAGTLGGGNHFIELCLDTSNTVWMMLHSGSRNIGKELAEFHITRAKKLAHNRDLPDRDLAVFLSGTKEMEEYRRDLFWAQRYAWLNRLVMLGLYRKALRRFFPHLQEVERTVCHHNYVAEEIHFGEEVLVTRKGAIRAGRGEMGIIPGSMGTSSYIVRGLGNPESFESASHGAGRRMSRGEAKRRYTTKDLERETIGVECRKDGGVLDEIPSAYKDIDEVMAHQSDLVEVVYRLKQVLCVKG